MKAPTPKAPPTTTKLPKKTFKELASENRRSKAQEERERLEEKSRRAAWAEEEEVMQQIYGPPKGDKEAAE